MHNVRNPAVPVIIPVYNVEDYLRKCMESVINQSLQTIEIICVNDGSTDGSPAILEEYRKKDPRILLINQENKGLSAARNCAMKMARGEYIYFLDSDDYIEPETLEKTVQIARDNDLDAVVFGYEQLCESGEIVYSPVFPSRENALYVYSGTEYMNAVKNNNTYIVFVWAALWRFDLIKENSICFKEGIIYEDTLFSFLAYIHAKRVIRIPDRFYHYRKRPDSITTKPIAIDKVKGHFYCALGVLEYALQNPREPEGEHEIQRAYYELSRATESMFRCLPEKERENILFLREIDRELFRQIIARYQVDELQKKLWIQKEKTAKVEETLSAREKEIYELRDALKEEQNEADFLQNEIGRIHASWTYRIGRAATWLPRKMRDGVRRFKEKNQQNHIT